jgi:hypothetical protein
MKKLLLTAFAMLLVASAASAVVLWDQSNLNAGGEGSLNLSSNSCSQISGNTKLHTASDVTFSTSVVLTSVTVYESYGNVQAATQAYLWIAPKTGSLPTTSSDLVNNAANLVTITATNATVNGVACVAVTASGLSRSLPAGDYWVSLTPKHSLGMFPYTVHLVTDGPVYGAPTCAVSACTVNSSWAVPLAPASWDYSLKIEGDMPVPVDGSTWGRVKSIYR